MSVLGVRVLLGTGVPTGTFSETVLFPASALSQAFSCLCHSSLRLTLLARIWWNSNSLRVWANMCEGRWLANAWGGEMWALPDVTHCTGQSILRIIHPNICVGGCALSVFVVEQRCTLSSLPEDNMKSYPLPRHWLYVKMDQNISFQKAGQPVITKNLHPTIWPKGAAKNGWKKT